MDLALRRPSSARSIGKIHRASEITPVVVHGGSTEVEPLAEGAEG